MKGFVPARSVVIPEAIPKFAADFQVPCINHWTRKPSTDLKTSLNNALREYDVAV
jgi:2,3,4,5-tetrahydropyridine-2-carboxylate N-succinyltransferase